MQFNSTHSFEYGGTVDDDVVTYMNTCATKIRDTLFADYEDDWLIVATVTPSGDEKVRMVIIVTSNSE